MTPPDPDLEPIDPAEPTPQPAGRAARVTGKLPGLLQSPRPRIPPGPETPPPPLPPPSSAATAPGASSTGSTDRRVFDEPDRGKVDLVPPKDFRDAIRQAADLAFVVVGQLIGSAHARRSGEEKDRRRWVPTRAERKQVAEPAHRIAKRHVESTKEAADVLDAALIAGGLGAFATRALFDLDSLEDLEDADA